MHISKLNFVLVLCISLISTTLFSQGNYWISFSDKNQSTYTLQHPEAFLSEKAIDRRFRQGIAIQENDLPVNPVYIEAIRTICPQIHIVSKWLNAVSVSIKDARQLEQIKQLAFVKSISSVRTLKNNSKNNLESKFEPIITIGTPAFNGSKYGAGFNQVNMIAIDSVHALGYTGKGMDIAVFDAGFTNVDNLDFFAIARQEGRIIPVWNYVDTNANVFIRSFHGTNVMSVMCSQINNVFVGAAPDARYFLFITEDQYHEQIIEEDNWVAAAEKADSIGVDIFTTSLGYTEFDDTTTNHTYAEMNGDSTVITKAANIAASKGILVVNSAGNEGNSSWRYISAPADGDSVLTIGAVNEYGILAGFSSRGPNSSNHLKPNVCGQGANITVCSQTNSVVGKSNGTSFSGPLIAASSACLWQAFPNKTSMEIFHEIEKCSHIYDTPNFDYGFGIPNFLKAFQKLENEILSQNPAITIPKVYPNPFRSTITILWNSSSDGPIQVALFNSLGQCITTQEITLPANTFSKIFLNHLEEKDAGTYTLRITQNKQSYTTTLIKY